MKGKRTLLRWIVVALIVAFAMWVPWIRQIVWFILPLGSGVDDLIMTVALIFAGIGTILYLTYGKFLIFENKDHPRRRHLYEDEEGGGLETFEAKGGKWE